MTAPHDLISPWADSLPALEIRSEPFPVRINFDQGLPDASVFPLDELRWCVNEVFDSQGANAFRYFGKEYTHQDMQYGFQGLREQIALYLVERDQREQPVDGVVLVEGSTNGLGLTINAYLGAGDGGVVEDPSYPYVRRFITSMGATVGSVPVDEDGMVVEALPAALAALRDSGHRPKLISTIPTFHSPTGTVLTLKRRHHLLEIAQEWGVLVLEDNCYYELYYDNPPPSSLRALDDGGLVLQSDSFSKTIAPGMRLAWLAGTPEAIEPIARVRQDFGVAQILARAVMIYMQRGKFLPHVAAMRDIYRTKRNVAVDALRQYCGPHVRYRIPGGGFYLWLEVSDSIDWNQARQLAAQAGVAFRPGDRFTAGANGPQFVRLSWAQTDLDDIEEGISILGGALARSVR